MKDLFYLMDVSQMKDGTAPTAIFSYEDTIAANIAYHQTIASKLANQDIEYAVVQLMGTAGNIIATQSINNQTVDGE